MAIAARLQSFLAQQGMDFNLIGHSHSDSSTETARAAHIPGDQIAKAVMVEDETGYLMVVIPSTHRLHLGRLHKALGRELGLATEVELPALFEDCELGAIPPVGAAYGIESVVDNALMEQPDVYLEAGDHENLIRLSRDEFNALMRDTPKGPYSDHV